MSGDLTIALVSPETGLSVLTSRAAGGIWALTSNSPPAIGP